jgi:Carboxymuconolactone decarboxylase family
MLQLKRVVRRRRAAPENQAVDRGRARDPMSVLHSRHTERALKHGATQQKVLEAIWVAAEMLAGAAYAHANLALETMNRLEAGDPTRRRGLDQRCGNRPVVSYTIMLEEAD